MYIKSERVFSSKFVALLLKYFLFTLILIVVTTGFLVLDGYLKCQFARDNPEVAEAAEMSLRA